MRSFLSGAGDPRDPASCRRPGPRKVPATTPERLFGLLVASLTSLCSRTWSPGAGAGLAGFRQRLYRGLTRVETHFQPSFGEVIYPCKEAVRKLIRSARRNILLMAKRGKDQWEIGFKSITIKAKSGHMVMFH
uniref:Uncharacterized protein n=1 Tax=Sphaerodactylus townsendi TaxID=933632 RepID=A0ACB8F5J7_9SAUR